MSEENVERLRQIHAEWARGNWRAGREVMASDVHVSWEVPEGFIVARGLEDVGPKLRDFLGQWREFRTEADEFIELDENSFLVVCTNHGIGKASGVEIDAPYFYVWRFRDGIVVSMHSAFARAEALEAAGLQE
jgi:hypothetical protein